MKTPRKSSRPLPPLKSATITIDDPTDNSPRLCRIEQKIDAMLVASKPTDLTINGVDIANLVAGAASKPITIKSVQALLQALRARRKIEAIKEIRAMLGIGLKEAKDLCEQHFFEPENIDKGMPGFHGI